MAWGRHANPATRAFGGAPDGATKRVRGVPKWGGAACGPCHWGLRWSSLWCHETCEGCAKVEGGGHAGFEDLVTFWALVFVLTNTLAL